MKIKSEVRVVGAGGHAKVVVATLLAAGFEVVALYDDARALWGTSVLGRPVVGPSEAMGSRDIPTVLGIGDNATRARLARALDVEWMSVVHPRAYVHESVELGRGTVVFAGAVIQPDARVGEHGIVNTGATIDHDCALGAFVHIAPGVHLCGAVSIGEGTLIGVGASAIPGISIGAWSVVGGGACCVRDVPDKSMAKGVPARSSKGSW